MKAKSPSDEPLLNPPQIVSFYSWNFSTFFFRVLNPSMGHNTVEAHEIVCRVDHTGKIGDSPQGKKQKAARALLRDELQKQDFAEPVSLRASRIPGKVSRFRIAQIMPQMNRASRASRPGLTVCLLRILCNGLCTAQIPCRGRGTDVWSWMPG